MRGGVARIEPLELTVGHLVGLPHGDVGHGLVDHAGGATRRHRVGPHAVARPFQGGDHGEGGDAGLGRAVVGLTRVPLKARRAHGVDDGRPPLASGLRFVVPPHAGVMGHVERALEVHADHAVPVGLRHLGDERVAQDPGVVDDHVESAVGVDGEAHGSLGALPRGDVLVGGDGLTAAIADDGHGVVGGALVRALALRAPARIAHHDLGALGRQLHRLAPSDAAARPGDDGDLALHDAH